MQYQLTKHARERYFQRFGQQDVKTILKRCGAEIDYKKSKDGVVHRHYGAICFVCLDETILTVTKVS